jgi:hypothetical protein
MEFVEPIAREEVSQNGRLIDPCSLAPPEKQKLPKAPLSAKKII